MRNDRRNDRRRDTGGRRIDDGGSSVKSALYAGLIILVLGVIAFFVTVKIYNKNLDKVYSELDNQRVGETTIVDKINDNSEEASSQMGKSIEELELEAQEVNAQNETNANNVEENTPKQGEESKAPSNTPKPETPKKETPAPTKEPEKDPEFISPVEGETMKEYAKDKLVYSETLKEWVVHTGIDIKAEKTTVVKAAEKGKVIAIKNDPRYGITVIIEHSNGFETRYANLLTAEFITVGEEVEKGQTIGTVGNTGAFEVLDDFHLHFEILKNGEYQDPVIYIG